MINGPIEWEDARVLLAVLRGGSAAAAARVLRLSGATVRRRLEILAERIGAPLFEADGPPWTPTAATRAVLPTIEAMNDAAELVARAAAEEHELVRGVVRVTSTEVLGEHVVVPALAALCADHPELKVDLTLINGSADVGEALGDVAILPRPPDPDLAIATPLGRLNWGLYAHESYLSRKGVPGCIADLAAFDLIGFETSLFEPIYANPLGRAFNDPCFGVRSNNVPFHFAALRAGLGIALCQSPLAARLSGVTRVVPQYAMSQDCVLYRAREQVGIRRVDIVEQVITDALVVYLSVG